MKKSILNLGILALIATSATAARADCISVYQNAAAQYSHDAVLSGKVCGAIVTIPVAAPLAITYAYKAKHRRKVLTLLQQARVGFGPTLERFYREVTTGNYPSKNTTFREMIEVLNDANETEILCTPHDDLSSYELIRDSFRQGQLQEGLKTRQHSIEAGVQVPEPTL